jgi:amino acid adenylation domain-containing protein
MLTDSERSALTARLRHGRTKTVNEIPRRDPGRTSLPLSYGQEQLWFLDRLAPGLPAYNIPIPLGLSGPLDAAALSRALESLIARHETLRTRLVTDSDGRPIQVIAAPGPVALEVTDFSAAGHRQLQEFIDAESVRPFSLADGPLLRPHLLRLGEQDHLLLVVVHHSVFDGWSAGVFLRELAALYGQEAAGEPAGLAELPVQFADYALWERDRLSGSVLEELEAYWRGVMAGYETLQFPADLPRPALDAFEGALAQRMTGRDLLDGLRELSRREGTTLFVTLLAGLAALLSRYTGQCDVVVGTASANRSRRDLASLIGFLVNTLPIRADLSGDPSFTELLARVKQATTGAYAHQDLPFGKLVETLGVVRDLSRAPVFQVTMTYAERNITPVHAAGVGFTLTDVIVGINAAKFDLSFLGEARSDGLWLECSYKTSLFEAPTIERLLGHYEVVLRAAVADPSTPLSRLPVLTGAELSQELTGWNDTAAQVPVMCVHEGFEAQVAQAPDAIAAEFGDERVSYAELNRRANQVARRLRVAGVGPETLVGVCLPPGLPRLAALLGTLKAGGGYVPLDPGLPADRLAFMVTDTAMPVIVTDTASQAALPGGVSTVLLDAEHDQIATLHGDNLEAGAEPQNVAYVIYTSGSTGEPKGVVVEHRQAVNFLHGLVHTWDVGPSDVVLQFGSFTFDASVMDMFLPLLAGARSVLVPAATRQSPRRLADLIRDTGVTFTLLPSAVLSLLADEQFPSLRVLMTGGEELPSEVARQWLRPGLRFVNAYGPTEATVIATWHELDGTVYPPPIGRPNWPNYQVYVLDEHLNPVPPGVTGELHVGGAGVARGYLNRPELTQERFIPDPFRSGGRLYKTGDLVRWRPDGTIAFVGRADNQVKINGLRIELGEIEAALTAHPAIAQAVVTVVTDPAGDKQLAAYLRTQPDAADLSLSQARTHLAQRLPAYMLPASVTIVAGFPLNTSGKIDRSALPAPQASAASGREAAGGHVPPATLIETMMVSLYSALLGQDQIGATDSFFDLGGNSLKAMRLVRMMDDELDVDLDVASVFLAPTPRQLAALLRDQHGFADDDVDADAAQAPGEMAVTA